jgi:drug/metabolite transporter (DMT)-like permease
VVFGSVVAFTAYSWLLQTAPVSQAATYDYVKPVLAVALGAVIAGEAITATSLVGGLVTLVAVYVVVTEEGRRPRATPPVASEEASQAA